jgi:hypothetical protein
MWSNTMSDIDNMPDMPLRLAALLAVLLAAMPAAAQQNVEERRACGPDAVRLCREFVPNQELINKCLFEKKEELSPACRTVMFGPEPATPTVAAPAAPATPVKQAARPEKARVIKVRARKRDHDCD